MMNLNDLRLFVDAIDAGGFAAAARLTGAPKSTISKRVGELEAELGARLIQRSSRRFALTELGREFYEHARAAVAESQAAEDVVRRRLAEPSGRVRITASVPVAQFQLAKPLAALVRTYPKLKVELHVTDRFVDIVHEGFDLAVRSHTAPLPDSDLLQRRLAIERTILVAAPVYLTLRRAPDMPQDLAEHDCVNPGPATGVWRLRNQEGDEVEVSPRPLFSADEAGVLLEAALSGLGVVALPETVAAVNLERGELVSILPDWFAGTITTTMLAPSRRGQLPAVRAVMDHLAQAGDLRPK